MFFFSVQDDIVCSIFQQRVSLREECIMHHYGTQKEDVAGMSLWEIAEKKLCGN
jgi:hypothetical protein